MSTIHEQCHEYAEWVEASKVTGFNSSTPRAEYVSEEALTKYWDEERIEVFLQSLEPNIVVDIPSIRKHYLRIFATLAYITTPGSSKVGYIQDFIRYNIDDFQMPHGAEDKPPPVFPGSPYGEETWGKFYENQWLFCPKQLWPIRLQDQTLDPRCVLPITVLHPLGKQAEGYAVAKKVQVHPPGGRFPCKDNIIVMKEYPGVDLEHDYKRETETYTSLNNKRMGESASKYFLSYYGCFRQNGKGVILLEYADVGSMLEFFATNDRPYEPTGFDALWKNLLELLQGLVILHHDDLWNKAMHTQHMHQDLKPSNIFVFDDSADGSYSYRFKIGDLGHSSVTRTTSNGEPVAPDKKGTMTYGPPELCNYTTPSRRLDGGVTSAADIWSLGCILLETAVWIAGGNRARKEFSARRQKENMTMTVHDHCQAGYGDSFHDGILRLKAVEDMPNIMTQWLSRCDDYTKQNANAVLEYMLVDQKYRFDAKHLQKVFIKRPHRIATGPEGTSGRAKYSPVIPSSNGITPTSDDRHNRHLSVSPGDSTYPAVQPPYEGVEALNTDSPFELDQHRNSTYNRSKGKRPEIASDQFRPAGLFSRDPGELALEQSLSSSKDFLGVPNQISHARFDPGNFRSGVATTSARMDSKQTNLTETASPKSSFQRSSVKELLAWIDQGRGVQDFPGREYASQCLTGRDMLFLIDDSMTMRPHWFEVIDTFRALGEIAKYFDPDGIELRFTSAPTKAFHKKKIAEFIKCIKENGPVSSGCMMEAALSNLGREVVDDAINASKPRASKRMRTLRKIIPGSAKHAATGLSIYILTDGRWEAANGTGGQDEAAGVEYVVRSLIEKLQKKDRQFLSLQFIQFGNDPEGSRRLKYLDDHCEDLTEFRWDIVDRKRHDGSVWPVMVGSLSKLEDNIDTDSTDEPGVETWEVSRRDKDPTRDMEGRKAA